MMLDFVGWEFLDSGKEGRELAPGSFSARRAVCGFAVAVESPLVPYTVWHNIQGPVTELRSGKLFSHNVFCFVHYIKTSLFIWNHALHNILKEKSH